MDIRQSFKVALRNLCANKVRFCHAMLGMMIGVGAAVLVLGISGSLFAIGDAQEETYAEGLINTRIYNNADSTKKITVKDLERAVAENPEVLRGVTPYVMFDLSGGVSYEGVSCDEAELLGVGEQYIDMLPVLHLREGRFLDHMDMDRERKSCVVGSYIADELIGGDALGKVVKVWGENYTVVGIMDTGYEVEEGGITVWLPYTNARKMVGETIRNNGTPYTYYMDQYFVWAQSRDTMYEAIQLIEQTCEEATGWKRGESWLHYSDGFSSIRVMIDGAIKTTVMQYLAFAAVIVLVGGVGIMNVMLASVQARTQEIGIRKAFGASFQMIRRQFMLEAVITSLFGGLLGLLLGFGCLLVVGIYEPLLPMGGGVYYPVSWHYMDWTTLGLPVLLTFGVSVGVGIIFGTYPAQQAAELEPAAAINSEV